MLRHGTPSALVRPRCFLGLYARAHLGPNGRLGTVTVPQGPTAVPSRGTSPRPKPASTGRKLVMRELAICRYCDTVHRRPDVLGRATARCVRCDSPLYHANADLGAMLAVTLTATVAFVIANGFPLISMSVNGHQTEATLWGAIVASYDQELPLVAAALTISLIIVPLIEIVLLLSVLVPLYAGTLPLGFSLIMRAIRLMRPWRMVEVFLLGVVVAVVKLAGLASTVPGWGSFGVVVMTFALASLGSFDPAALWRRAEEVRA